MPSDSTSDATPATSDATPTAAATGPGSRSPLSRARRIGGTGSAATPTPTPAPEAREPQASDKPKPKATDTPDAPRAADAPLRRSGVVTAARPSDREAEEPAEDVTDAPAPSKAGRNLPAAIAVGLALGGLIVASLFVWRPAFAIIAGVAVLYGCYELSRALSTAGIRVTLLPLLVGGAAMLVAAWERGPSGLVLGALITVLGVLVWRLGDGAEGYGRDIGASALAVLYLPMLAGFAVLLAHPHDGAARVLAFVATVVCSDTGGYATGVLFGKHPLAPIVSKGKTWEGFAGSVLACSGAGVLFMVFTFHHEWWKGLLFGLAVVVTATVGDLGESMIKRDVGLKDMGSLLPGHGGVMDRLDSLLPCAAVAYLILSGFAPV